MKKQKTFKVMVEIPERWIDLENSPIGWASVKVKEIVETKIQTAIIKQYLEKAKMPDIKIPEAEIREGVKRAIIDRLTDKAMERR